MSNETSEGVDLDATLFIPQPIVNRELIEPSAKDGQTEYYKPIGDRVLIEPYTVSSTNTYAGLVLPVDQDRPTNIGIVVETGTAFLSEDVRKYYPFSIKSTVVFNPVGAIEIIKDGRKLFIIDCPNIIAVKEIKNIDEKIVHDINSILATVE